MSAAPDPQTWPHRRWWASLALVFALQLALIFLLSDRKVPRFRPGKPVPQLRFASAAAAELWALTDPTLFALPNAHGFSAAVWLKAPRLAMRQFDWSEPTNWLTISAQHLGRTVNPGRETPGLNAGASVELTQPQVMAPEFSSAVLPTPREQSSWRLDGEITLRRLKTNLSLTNPAHTDLLTNSIVLLTVGADGKPFSVPILLSSSGSKTADDQALHLTSVLRFEPLTLNQPAGSKPPLTFGKVIFEWATLPVPPTNPPAVQP